VRVHVGPVHGSYQGQEARRAYAFRMLARARPARVTANGAELPALADRAAYDQADVGWFFDPAERLGTLHAKTAKQDIRAALALEVQGAAAAAHADDAFPAAPEPGRALAADSLIVVNRPAEEAGQPLENAFDGKPGTWFRTVRNQAVRSGPHEWVIGFTERRLIDGIELAPRNDKYWQHGQVRDYEVYVADRNGDWGVPAARGRLKLAEQMQTISFDPVAGRLLRFRVLSTHNPDGESASANDPMVLAAQAGAPAAAYNALLAPDVAPVTLSEFHILEHRVPEGPEQQRYLSDLALPKSVQRDRPAGKGGALRMNGLWFRRGLGVGPASRIDLKLDGGWTMLRADLGIDDSCRAAGGLQFQVWSGARLLYDSGLVQAPAVVKPELDVRGLKELSLRTLGARGPDPAHVCGNWGNAVLIGPAGAAVRLP